MEHKFYEGAQLQLVPSEQQKGTRFVNFNLVEDVIHRLLAGGICMKIVGFAESAHAYKFNMLCKIEIRNNKF